MLISNTALLYYSPSHLVSSIEELLHVFVHMSLLMQLINIVQGNFEKEQLQRAVEHDSQIHFKRPGISGGALPTR